MPKCFEIARQGLKAKMDLLQVAARLKPFPDYKTLLSGVFPQPLQPSGAKAPYLLAI
jgi:hypothetical protein